mgnify:CR=1 FL=1
MRSEERRSAHQERVILQTLWEFKLIYIFLYLCKLQHHLLPFAAPWWLSNGAMAQSSYREDLAAFSGEIYISRSSRTNGSLVSRQIQASDCCKILYFEDPLFVVISSSLQFFMHIKFVDLDLVLVSHYPFQLTNKGHYLPLLNFCFSNLDWFLSVNLGWDSYVYS